MLLRWGPRTRILALFRRRTIPGFSSDAAQAIKSRKCEKNVIETRAASRIAVRNRVAQIAACDLLLIVNAGGGRGGECIVRVHVKLSQQEVCCNLGVSQLLDNFSGSNYQFYLLQQNKA